MSVTLRSPYAFAGADEIDAQLAALETMLDPGTLHCIDRLGIPAAGRCWEIGAGAGSIARHLVDVVGPAGTVVATDLDISRVQAPGARILRHDVRSQRAPDGGPFDLIHARWVLMHLPERRRVLNQLIDSLAPGGWLLIEESAVPPHVAPVLTSSSTADAHLFERFTRAVVQILMDQGADPNWGASGLHTVMAQSCLTDVGGVHRADVWTGGGPGGHLHAIHTRQLRAPLHTKGFTDEDLAEIRRIAGDPQFSALWYPLVSAYGRKAS